MEFTMAFSFASIDKERINCYEKDKEKRFANLQDYYDMKHLSV